jgi:hypothetical protein
LEMHNVGVAFVVLEDGKPSAPQGRAKASDHIIWDLIWTSRGRQDGSWVVTSCLRLKDQHMLVLFPGKV